MNVDLDVPPAYRRAALLAAVLSFQNGIKLPKRIFQHYDWSGKNCPRVLRVAPNGWHDFVSQILRFREKLTNVPVMTIAMNSAQDHHLFD
jgi:N-acetylmuramoyl-L-alanine amidase CwlA